MAVGLGWKLGVIAQYMASCVYDASRITHARTGSRRDLGSYRLSLVEAY